MNKEEEQALIIRLMTLEESFLRLTDSVSKIVDVLDTQVKTINRLVEVLQ